MNNLLVINRVRSGLKQIASVVTHKIHRGYYNQVVNSNNKKEFPEKLTLHSKTASFLKLPEDRIHSCLKNGLEETRRK